jgi:hypothetical protein
MRKIINSTATIYQAIKALFHFKKGNNEESILKGCALAD